MILGHRRDLAAPARRERTASASMVARENLHLTAPPTNCQSAALPPRYVIAVPINIAGRSLVTCVFPAQRSAQWRLDNCYADHAVTNAQQLLDLLNAADVEAVPPQG
jgi:hypothetical protein